MTPRPEPREIRRIVLAVAPAGMNPAAASLALKLAQRYQAELASLLVEDPDLLRAGALPFTSEIAWYSGAERQLDPGSLARQLRAQAARLREDIARRAEGGGVRWSFEVVRGARLPEALQGLGESDVLVLGSPRRASAGAAQGDGGILLLQSGSVDDARARSVLAALSAMRTLPEQERPRAEAAESVPGDGFEEFLARVRARRPGLIVVPAALGVQRQQLLRELLQLLGGPVMLVA